MLENESWSHLSERVFSEYLDSDFNKQRMRLATTDAKINSQFLKSENMNTIGSELCANNTIGVGISNDHREDDFNDFFPAAWPNTVSLEDANNMFRSVDSTFGCGEFDNEDGFNYILSKCMEESDAVIKSGSRLLYPESSSSKHKVEKNGSSEMVNMSSSDSEFNCSLSTTSTDKAQVSLDLSIAWEVGERRISDLLPKMEKFSLPSLLRKMTHNDKDYRYMAIWDLIKELNSTEFELDFDAEIKLSNLIIQLLDDISVDVSALAVKCLAALVKYFSEEQILEMTAKLSEKLLNGKEQHRDIASIALKTIIFEVPSHYIAESCLSSITPYLLEGITGLVVDTEIKCECLDIVRDLLPRYKAPDHEWLLSALLPQLSFKQATVRKKTVSCIAALASSLSDDLLQKATVEVVQLLRRKGTEPEMICTIVQMIGALSRAIGYRFGPHLEDTVPLLITSASENDEKLREYSIQALESFLLRCHRDISSYCDSILNLALEYISYNPNFTAEMEEDSDYESYEDEEDAESETEYTNDEDNSWKVRRAAAKCLIALIVSQPEMLGNLYKKICPKLIDGFREREENVKIDVFNTFVELLHQIGNVTKGQTDMNETSPRWLLKQDVPKIVRSITRQLQEKSNKTKISAFSILKELVVVLPDCLADHIGSLIPGISKALRDKFATSNLKIEALLFTRLVLASHPPSVFYPYVKDFCSSVLSVVGERYYKVRAEALRVCGELLVRIMQPNIEGFCFDFKPYVHPVHDAIMSCLRHQDQDQEVKLCATYCTGLVISTFGDNLKAELPVCLPVLAERLGNEVTRLAAIKAFAVIGASPLRVNLSCILEHVIEQLSTFLCKVDRTLTRATLAALKSLIEAYGDDIGSDAYEGIITELSTMISDSDLSMAASALELCCTFTNDRRIAEVGSSMRNKVLPQALALLRSSLLQGQSLLALQNFFVALVYSETRCFDALIDAFVSITNPSAERVSKPALISTAQCVAVVCLLAGDSRCYSTVKMLANILKDDVDNNSSKKWLALLCLGEIGRRKDLSSHTHIENIVIESFQSHSEEIKSAAFYALGNIATSNLEKYLPFILDQIDNQQNKQYLLLLSLKEVIARQLVKNTGFQDSIVEKILNFLFNHCESNEEGVRNVVAECLGKLALIEPAKLIPALKEHTKSPAAFIRATVIIAVKYAIVERPGKIDDIIHPEISSFLILIKDDDRHVRRAAILALKTVAHKKPKLIKSLLRELLPLLYNQTVVEQEMIKTVNLGSFKHVMDDGLELRKAAFECVNTILDSCFDEVNPSLFVVPYLRSGLDDHYDIKMECHSILSKLTDKCPWAVLAVLDSLVDPLHKTVILRPETNAVKLEFNRNEDMIRSALRAIASINRVSGRDCDHKFKCLVNEIMRSPAMGDKFFSIQNESNFKIPNKIPLMEENSMCFVIDMMML